MTIQRWALFDENGKPRKIVSGDKPHPSALPVVYPSLDTIDRVSNKVMQKDISLWDVSAVDVTVTYDIIPIDLEQTKRHLKNVIAIHRYQVEVGGITLPDGSKMPTDRETQMRIGLAHQTLTTFPNRSPISWKLDTGWVTVDATVIGVMAEAIADHVQFCYKAEETVHGKIDAAATVVDLMAIDIKTEFKAAYDSFVAALP